MQVFWSKLEAVTSNITAPNGGYTAAVRWRWGLTARKASVHVRTPWPDSFLHVLDQVLQLLRVSFSIGVLLCELVKVRSKLLEHQFCVLGLPGCFFHFFDLFFYVSFQ